MIKIDIDSTPEKSKVVIMGSVEVKGDINVVSHEIYAILKDFEKETPEALANAIEMLVEEKYEL